MKLDDGRLDGWRCTAQPWCKGLYGERADLVEQRRQIAREQV